MLVAAVGRWGVEPAAAVCDSECSPLKTVYPAGEKRVARRMTKPPKQKTFDEVLATLGNERFDLSPATEGANRAAGAYRVNKYGCAAEILKGPNGELSILAKPGWVLGGEIARLTDRGYQKFLKTSKLEIPATADILRAIHKFDEDLKEATGANILYNEAMGTTSDLYVYDRVKGRA
jgi:hypothetical protein